MPIANFIDPLSIAIVLGGTILATMLRSGRDEISATFYKLFRLGRRFRFGRIRAEIAKPVADMRKDGVHRAHFEMVTDKDLREVLQALVHERSVVKMLETHTRQRLERSKRREMASRTLYQAGELAPVLGLAGTLVSLGMMPAEEIAKGSITGSLGMAVITTLYGLIAAHFLFLPLGRAIERRGEVEEQRRQELIAWISDQLADACPTMAKRRASDARRRDSDRPENGGEPQPGGVVPLERRA